MKCPNCGAARYASEAKCRYCGTDYDDIPTARGAEPQPVMHVHYHQEALQKEVRVERVYVPQPYRSDCNRAVALILCLLFGMLGIHKFYLGKNGLGLLYIFTGGLCGMGIFIDLIVLLIGTPRDGRGLPVTWK